ncbi:eukaryotic rRNA processing protein EBP2-domain-containing protein [Hyaloraphidium curvatum]|nr:eukaryotic rRNA processing protein EBP2-domain-containing protein [Hyaloraphidium curvatum]
MAKQRKQAPAKPAPQKGAKVSFDKKPAKVAPPPSDDDDGESDFDFGQDGDDFDFEDLESFIRAQSLEGTDIGNAMMAGESSTASPAKSESAKKAKTDSKPGESKAKQSRSAPDEAPAAKHGKKDAAKKAGAVAVPKGKPGQPAKDSRKAAALLPRTDEESDDDEEGDSSEEMDEEEAAYALMVAEKAGADGSQSEDEDGSEASADDGSDDDGSGSDDDEAPLVAGKKGFVPKKDINNIPALVARYNDIRLDQPGVTVPWIETMVVTSSKPLRDSIAEEAVHDDMKREQAFYDQALASALAGRQMVLAAGVPFSRPDDYFAEMVKSDEQMEKVRRNLIEEAAAIKRADEMKRLREAKKFGKQVQVQKLQERQKQKSKDLEKIQKLKRKRQDGAGAGDGEDFDVEIDNAFSDERPSKKARQDAGGKSKKRKLKDDKYSYGGKKKFSKSNTRDSLDAVDGFDPKSMKKPFGGGKGKFKPKFKVGKPGMKKGGKKMRPGKSKRMQGKGKGR